MKPTSPACANLDSPGLVLRFFRAPAPRMARRAHASLRLSGRRIAIACALAFFPLGAGSWTHASEAADPPPARPLSGEPDALARLLTETISQTEWPTNSFASQASPIVLVIIGDARLAENLKASPGLRIGRRPLLVQHLAHAREFSGMELSGRQRAQSLPAEQDKTGALRQCHVLFVASSETASLARLLKAVANRPVLSVGESASFARRGGILNLTRVNGSRQVEINLDALRLSGLRINSRLLGIAKLVSDDPEVRNH